MNPQQFHPQIDLPSPFEPDWHHLFQTKLSVFPRKLSIPAPGGPQNFWPDLGTFIDDPDRRLLMYYPGASRSSICVVYWKRCEVWEAVKFDDDAPVRSTRGASFEEAMANTVEQFA